MSALRTIDISGEDRRARPTGQRPELHWVKISDLVIDESYQRQIETRGWKSIRRISDNFNWGRFSPLLVAKGQNGALAIIDGQHRAHAAALCGIEEVPALVAEMTPQEQAAAFSWVNGAVTALTPVQIYRAALAAMEPWAVQCKEAVERGSCTLMTYNKSAEQRAAGEVFCISLIRKSIEAGSAQNVIAALGGLRASDQGEMPDFYGAGFLGGLIALAEHRAIRNPDAMSAFLNTINLFKVEAAIHTMRQKPEFRSKSAKALFADSLIALYNKWLLKSAEQAA